MINIPAEDTSPAAEATEERSLIPYSAAEQTEQPEALAQLDVFELKPDTSVDGSAFSGPVAKLVKQMPEAYKTASLSSGESYYSNFVRTLLVGGRPMSPSNRQTVVIPIKYTDKSTLSDKGKGKAEEAPAGSPVLSDDEASAAFARMSPAKREKLKLELFKCFLEPYIKGLRGASSGLVGYMSQLAAEVSFSLDAPIPYLRYLLIFLTFVLTFLSSFLFQLFARSMITEDWAKELRKENKKLVQDVTAAADHAQFVISEQRCCISKPRLLWKNGRLSWNLRSKSTSFG